MRNSAGLPASAESRVRGDGGDVWATIGPENAGARARPLSRKPRRERALGDRENAGSRELGAPAPRLALALAEAAALGRGPELSDADVRPGLPLARRGRTVLAPLAGLERWIAENADGASAPGEAERQGGDDASERPPAQLEQRLAPEPELAGAEDWLRRASRSRACALASARRILVRRSELGGRAAT